LPTSWQKLATICRKTVKKIASHQIKTNGAIVEKVRWCNIKKRKKNAMVQ
jgi:hypothetical protein